ncbi:MAG: hypothetical protein IKS76_01600 [Paludibacteraceae bacterium]|nr:hypothetical protein [Paludibacteraceae bacterium]
MDADFTKDELIAYAKNDATYMHYLKRLCGLAQSVIAIDGLPEEIDPEAVRRFLLFRVAVAGATDDVTGERMILPVVPNERFDNYGRLTKRIIYSPFTSFRVECDPENSEVIYDNIMKAPILPDLAMFAQRLADVTRGIDVNIAHQKTPYIISTTKRGKVTLEEMYRKAEANVPIIYADKAVDVDTIQTFPTAQPFQAEQMWDLRTSIWNDALTFIGVETSATGAKRERLISAEVDGNNAQINNHLKLRLDAWKDGFDRLNKLWGTDISVQYNSDVEKEADLDDEELSEDEDNIRE